MNPSSPCVKICGLCSEDDIKAVAEMNPDAMGFIFWEPSKRYVLPQRVGEWTKMISPDIWKVGVFVDAPLDVILECIQLAGLDVVQLHGAESPELCRDIPVKVWKALHLDRTDPQTVASYLVDAFLVDSYSTQAPGGTGQCCDWQVAKDFVAQTSTPVWLAGGLNPDNVQEAVAQVHPWGVDVSSGVEMSPGVKNISLVREFIERCRQK